MRFCDAQRPHARESLRAAGVPAHPPPRGTPNDIPGRELVGPATGPLRLDGGVVNAQCGRSSPTGQPAPSDRTDRRHRRDTVLLEVVTTQSQITIAMAARTRAYVDGDADRTTRLTRWTSRTEIGHGVRARAEPGVPVTRGEDRRRRHAPGTGPISTPALAVAAWAPAPLPVRRTARRSRAGLGRTLAPVRRHRARRGSERGRR